VRDYFDLRRAGRDRRLRRHARRLVSGDVAENPSIIGIVGASSASLNLRGAISSIVGKPRQPFAYGNSRTVSMTRPADATASSLSATDQ